MQNSTTAIFHYFMIVWKPQGRVQAQPHLAQHLNGALRGLWPELSKYSFLLLQTTKSRSSEWLPS